VLLVSATTFFLLANAVAADPATASLDTRGLFHCAIPTSGPLADPEARRQKLFDSALNAANGMAYFGGALGVELGASPRRRSSGTNGFDDALREGLRGGSLKLRERARRASDATLAVGIGVLPFASIGAQYFRTHDCLETWDMTADWLESFGLTLFLTQASKMIVGRERPYTQDCTSPNPPDDAECNSDDRYLSFPSGHASQTAAGAGLTCAFSLNRHAWGSSLSARYTPCVLGVTTAVASGVLRITADRHWATDVLTGFAIGGIVGYFDTWGPFDLLRFRTRDDGGRISSTGMVLPFSHEGRLGAQLVMVF
jgi:hypothetical protein